MGSGEGINIDSKEFIEEILLKDKKKVKIKELNKILKVLILCFLKYQFNKIRDKNVSIDFMLCYTYGLNRSRFYYIIKEVKSFDKDRIKDFLGTDKEIFFDLVDSRDNPLGEKCFLDRWVMFDIFLKHDYIEEKRAGLTDRELNAVKKIKKEKESPTEPNQIRKADVALDIFNEIRGHEHLIHSNQPYTEDDVAICRSICMNMGYKRMLLSEACAIFNFPIQKFLEILIDNSDVQRDLNFAIKFIMFIGGNHVVLKSYNLLIQRLDCEKTSEDTRSMEWEERDSNGNRIKKRSTKKELQIPTRDLKDLIKDFTGTFIEEKEKDADGDNDLHSEEFVKMLVENNYDLVKKFVNNV